LTRKGDPLQKTWCPLDLTIPDGHRLAKIIWSPEEFEEMFPRFSSWLSRNTLLTRLRQLQMELDPIGVLENDRNNENFRAAMTLRDCTVFVRFPENAEDDQCGIEARIGDLDLKSSDKAQYWKDTETALIEEGWYTGTEKEEDHQPLTCQLSRNVADAMGEGTLSNS
jgi:inositol-pentakisphosphate 2-kinase